MDIVNEYSKPIENVAEIVRKALMYYADRNLWKKYEYYDMNPYDISSYRAPDPKLAQEALAAMDKYTEEQL